MLIFENPGLVDEVAAVTMGVSAKKKVGAIGQFGTGLKDGIAIVLRLGGRVEIMRGRKRLVFGKKRQQVRGQDFDVVTLNGRKLGFTTHLGAHWEPWMAYREFWSNCRDEGGSVRRADHTLEMYEGTAGRTAVLIECPELERAHEERHLIVLQTEAMHTTPEVEIHAGASEYLFYRGIRVLKLPKRSAHTYNIVSEQKLTEDRTLLYSWMAPSIVARAIVRATSITFLHSVLGTERDSHRDDWESTLPFASITDQTPSPQFMEVAEQLEIAKKLRSGAGQVFKEYQDTLPGYVSPYIVELTAAEEEVVAAALALAVSVGMELTRPQLQFKSVLKLGRVQTGSSGGMVLDHALVRAGHVALAAALVEGCALRAGGSPVEQLASFVVGRAFLPREWRRGVGETVDSDIEIF